MVRNLTRAMQSAGPIKWMELNFASSKTKSYKSCYANHAVLLADGNILILSGADRTSMVNMYFLFNPCTREWSNGRLLHMGLPFDGIACYSIVAVRKRVYLFGGVRSDGDLSDRLYEFDVKRMTLRNVNISGNLPFARMGHSFAYSPDSKRVYLFGGVTTSSSTSTINNWSPFMKLVKTPPNKYLNDVYALDVSSTNLTWTHVSRLRRCFCRKVVFCTIFMGGSAGKIESRPMCGDVCTFRSCVEVVKWTNAPDPSLLGQQVQIRYRRRRTTEGDLIPR
ncbi:hypothetical protein ACOME3_001220 [Neoechinorhynchus agilis]